MNKKEFLSNTEHDATNVLCIDFDGVIHEDHLGFYDGTIYGSPIEGALESIKLLSKKYKIVIYTCKANPNRPIINNKTGTELIWEWLKKHEVDSYVTDITFNKPVAVAYVDDKAIRFNNWKDCINILNNL